MRRFINLRIVNIGSGASLGEIAVSTDAIIALEPSQGRQITVVTIQGGRSFTTDTTIDKLQAAIVNRRPALRETDQSAFARTFGPRAFETFFGTPRAFR